MKNTVTQNTTHSPPAMFFTKRYCIYLNSCRPSLIFFNFILLCCFLIATTSCEKYLADQSPPPDLEKESFRLNHYGNAGIFSTIPADISQYNLLTGEKTKSSADSAPNDSSASATFCLDSALLWHLEQQLYFDKENILYRQIPLQMEGGKIYCSIADKFYAGTSDSQNTGSLSEITKVKSYCIIVEAPHKGEQRKYLVTMFPEYSSTGFNENCTYLEKGNYSGLIIFSSVEGVFQKIEHYKNGLILQGKMLSAEDIANRTTCEDSEDIIYLTVYRQYPIYTNTSSDDFSKTKSSSEDEDVAWDDKLNDVIVVGSENKHADIIVDGSGAGGDGGDTSPTLPPIEGSGYDNEGGSGNSSGNDELINYTISVSVVGNGTASGGGTYTKNTNVILTASCNNENTFGGWVKDFEIESMELAYPIKVESNCSYIAYFHRTDTECGRLAQKYKNNKDLKAGFDLIDSIRAGNNEIEHGIYKTDNITNGYIEGNAHSVTIPWNKGTYDYFIHSHPNNTLIPSIEDIYGIYLSYKQGVFNSESVLFLQTYYGCLGFEIEDIDLLENFFKTEVFQDEEKSHLEQFARFKQKFNKRILGNPLSSNILNDEYSNKSIGYYIQRGLKIAKAVKDTNGKNISWAYAKQIDTIITYKDCIQIN